MNRQLQTWMLALLFGCSLGFAQRVTQTIGPAGGTVIGPDGVTVIVFAGLQRPVQISIWRANPRLLSSQLELFPNETFISGFYSISASEFLSKIGTATIEVRIPIPKSIPQDQVIAGVHYWSGFSTDVTKKRFVWGRGNSRYNPSYDGFSDSFSAVGTIPVTYVLIRRGK